MVPLRDSSSITVLAIDTSQSVLGLALLRGSSLLASLLDDSGLPHSQRLFPLIESTLREHHLAITDIDLFAVNTGPGSFTGLRVGLAAVRGIAATLGKPVLGVGALDALALDIEDPEAIIISLLNATREEVFIGKRRRMAEGQVQIIGSDRVLPVARVAQLLATEIGEEKAILIGNGATMIWPDIPQQSEFALALAPVSLAPTIARWASRQGAPSATAKIEAYYLRPSDAEIKKLA
ncbi:MAG: tRNA (adenosine(37)-N6)-threonylcarbamoyltransferase complex dimerization subunit type 1 TsaB [Blastocatellia bacterium]